MPQWIPEKNRKNAEGQKKKLNEKKGSTKVWLRTSFFNHLEIPLLIHSSLRLNYG